MTGPVSKDDAFWEPYQRLVAEAGDLHHLDPRHHALFIDAELDALLVTFETLDDIRARPRQMPLGFDIATKKGWSLLCLISDGDTWFRSPAVYRHFDRLVDDGFFDEFDRVLFLGSGAEGHAACAFSIAAPAARVLALGPRASANPALTGWDPRLRKARRLDVTSRYGDAPQMLQAAAAAHLLIPAPAPDEAALDAMHGALYAQSGAPVQRYPLPYLGKAAALALDDMALWPELAEAALHDCLSPVTLAQMMRARRGFFPYVAALADRLAQLGQRAREETVCRHGAETFNQPRFRRRLARLAETGGDGPDAPKDTRADAP